MIFGSNEEKSLDGVINLMFGHESSLDRKDFELNM